MRTTVPLLACAVSLSLSGCCELRAALAPPVRDRLETYVMVGVDAVPRCPLPPRLKPARILQPGESASIWLRSVSKDDLRDPKSQTQIVLDVIDPFGHPASDVTIEPASVLTNEQGFNPEQIRVTAARPIGGIFVRATYGDKQSTAVSLSRQIVVRPAEETTPTHLRRR